MSDKMRWRYGDTNPVVAAVDSETVIEIGDLLWQDTDDAKPASDITDQGTEPANQEALADAFLGVAMQRSRSGDTAPVRVAATGVFEFDCPSGTFELGDPVGADENAAGDALLNQQVASVAAAAYAIGRVAKRQAAAATSVLIDIRSTVMTGGVEGSAPS
ncbi:MAG: DUF2190 family protein [Planctomycetes bacterium]|nr:DUF2190 family protein [Planctomycetota bacterium]MBU4400853.1 DUF2190 family protein [Planctomycetota bacterium]MCG2685440.1 DUF2190 family protein [Planctomycetales bacterium]